MSIKLFVMDMDGTLLDEAYQITEDNKLAIKKLADKGITATIATGRMYVSALPYAKQLGVDVPIITYNGALIKSVSGKVYFEKYLPTDVVKDVYDFCISNNWYVHTYADDKLYFREYAEKAKLYEKLAGIKGHYVGDAITNIVDKIPKMLVITSGIEETTKVVKLLQERLGDRAFVARSNDDYIEIVNPDVNKAKALDILLKQLDISREETVAIGDSQNDLPMLKTAGMSIAMGNARAEIQQAADFVTEDNAHSGLARAIEKYVLKD